MGMIAFLRDPGAAATVRCDSLPSNEEQPVASRVLAGCDQKTALVVSLRIESTRAGQQRKTFWFRLRARRRLHSMRSGMAWYVSAKVLAGFLRIRWWHNGGRCEG